MPGPLNVAIEVSAKDLAKLEAKLAKLYGLPLGQRSQKAAKAVLRVVVAPLRAAAPIGGGKIKGGALYPPGTLRRSVRVFRRQRLHPGEVAYAGVGPTAPHKFLVSRGTKPHSLAVVRSGKSNFAAFDVDQVRPLAGMFNPGAHANPYVEEVQSAMEGELVRLFERGVYPPALL